MVETLVRLRISTEGIVSVEKGSRALEGMEKRVNRLQGLLGQTTGVFGRLGAIILNPVSSIFSALGSTVGFLITGPFKLLTGAIGLVGSAFTGLINLIRANPLTSLIGGVLAIEGIRRLTSSLVGAAGVQEEALKKVESAVISQGKNWDDYKGKVLSVTSALQKKTNFADEQQLEALSELVTILGDVDKSLEVLPIVMDVSARHGLDLASASRAIGLALKGDLGLIGRYVPALRGLTEEQKTQDNILRILNQTYKGTAETLAKTSSGALKQAANVWGEVKESIGFFIQDALAPLARRITANLFVINDWLSAIREGRETWQRFAGALGVTVINVFTSVQSFLRGMIPTFLQIGRELWGALGGTVSFLWEKAKEGALIAVSSIVDVFREYGPSVADALRSVITDLWQEVEPTVTAGIDRIKEFFSSQVPLFLEQGKEWGKALGEGMIVSIGEILAQHPNITTILGALAGAGIGATVGSVVPGVGTVIGAGAGAAAGAAGAEATRINIVGEGREISARREMEKKERSERRIVESRFSPETLRSFERAGVDIVQTPQGQAILGEILDELKGIKQDTGEFSRRVTPRGADVHFTN